MLRLQTWTKHDMQPCEPVITDLQLDPSTQHSVCTHAKQLRLIIPSTPAHPGHKCMGVQRTLCSMFPASQAINKTTNGCAMGQVPLM